jgi:hypothetical protein
MKKVFYVSYNFKHLQPSEAMIVFDTYNALLE